MGVRRQDSRNLAGLGLMALACTAAAWAAGAPEPMATVAQMHSSCRVQYAQSAQELSEANRQRGGSGETSLRWSDPEEFCGCVEHTATEKRPNAKADTAIAVREWQQATKHCLAMAIKEGFSAHCPTWFDSHATPERRASLSAAQKEAGCGCVSGYLNGRTDHQFEMLVNRSQGVPGDDPTLTPSDPKTLEELVNRCMDNGKL